MPVCKSALANHVEKNSTHLFVKAFKMLAMQWGMTCIIGTIVNCSLLVLCCAGGCSTSRQLPPRRLNASLKEYHTMSLDFQRWCLRTPRTVTALSKKCRQTHTFSIFAPASFCARPPLQTPQGRIAPSISMPCELQAHTRENAYSDLPTQVRRPKKSGMIVLLAHICKHFLNVFTSTCTYSQALLLEHIHKLRGR